MSEHSGYRVGEKRSHKPAATKTTPIAVNQTRQKARVARRKSSLVPNARDAALVQALREHRERVRLVHEGDRKAGLRGEAAGGGGELGVVLDVPRRQPLGGSAQRSHAAASPA